MSILVTGCAGFIGSHLCEFLLKNTDYYVYGIDNLNDYYSVEQKQKNLEILNNLSTPENSKFIFYNTDLVKTNLISEIKPKIVINLGAMAGVRYSIEHPEIYMRTNIEGHTHLLQECIKNGVEKFIYASSSSVYGNNTKIPFEESDDTNNQCSPYALSKKMCENVSDLFTSLYSGCVQIVGFRFFTVYGERGRPDMAPYIFVKNILEGKPIVKYGDGTSMRDYTYISDIISGIVGAINKKDFNKRHEIYNLGNNKPISLNDFIKTIETETGKQAIIINKPMPLGDVPITYANIDKAKRELNYEPKTKINEGIKKLVEYFS